MGYAIFIIILMLLAIMMTVSILLQPSKGGGLEGSAFGGIGGQFGSVFGVRQASDFLQKFTVWTAVAILLLTLATNLWLLDPAEIGGRSPVTARPGISKELPVTAPAAPAGGGLPTDQPAGNEGQPSGGN